MLTLTDVLTTCVVVIFRIKVTLTLKMTTAQVVETSVTVNNNSPIQDYVHLDDQIQPTFKNILLLKFIIIIVIKLLLTY